MKYECILNDATLKLEGSAEEISDVLETEDKLINKQLTAQELDYIIAAKELIFQHDRTVVERIIKDLKQKGGEEWAIGETIQRIIE